MLCPVNRLVSMLGWVCLGQVQTEVLYEGEGGGHCIKDYHSVAKGSLTVLSKSNRE